MECGGVDLKKEREKARLFVIFCGEKRKDSRRQGKRGISGSTPSFSRRRTETLFGSLFFDRRRFKSSLS